MTVLSSTIEDGCHFSSLFSTNFSLRYVVTFCCHAYYLKIFKINFTHTTINIKSLFDIQICFIYIYMHIDWHGLIFINPKSIISCSTYVCRIPPRNGTLDPDGPMGRWVDDGEHQPSAWCFLMVFLCFSGILLGRSNIKFKYGDSSRNWRV